MTGDPQILGRLLIGDTPFALGRRSRRRKRSSRSALGGLDNTGYRFV